jgi:hypothetical protein
MSKTRKNLVEQGIELLRKKLPPVFDEASLSEEIRQLLDSNIISMGDSTRWRLHNSARQIAIQWNKKIFKQLYSFDKAYEAIEMAAAWAKKHTYISHYSALYWNELVAQKPTEYFISTEIQAHSNAKKNSINEGALRLSFMKGPRVTQYFGTFEGVKYYFIERAYCAQVGVIEKKIHRENKNIIFHCTDIERTLLDSIISPHYSGGMGLISKAFAKTKINISKLHKYYKELKLLYPYWQTIGFVIEIAHGSSLANKWKELFGDPKIDFYFDRNARSDWNKSDKWRIFYPKGLETE